MSRLSGILRDTTDNGLVFFCPGCNCAHRIQHGAGPGPRWGWNGDCEKPTFSPSVLMTSERWDPPVTSENLAQWKAEPWTQSKIKHVCHSFVTDGRIQFLSDSTHELAGQTVDLPCWPGEEE